MYIFAEKVTDIFLDIIVLTSSLLADCLHALTCEKGKRKKIEKETKRKCLMLNAHLAVAVKCKFVYIKCFVFVAYLIVDFFCLCA